MSKNKSFFVLLVAGILGASLILSSCGGGNGGGDVAPQPASITSFAASVSTVVVGTSLQLSWGTQNTSGSDPCTASASPAETDWSGSVAANSSGTTVTPQTVGTATYTLGPCTGSGGNSGTKSVQITVTAAPQPASITSFAASVSTVVVGTSLQLSWGTQNTSGSDPCTASASPAETDWSGSVAANSSGTTVTPQTVGTATYTLGPCTGSGGNSGTKSVQITVTAASQQSTITSISPLIFGCNDDYYCEGSINPTLNGTNFSSGCTNNVSVTPLPALMGWEYESPTEIFGGMDFDQNTYNPGTFVFQACTQSQQTISDPYTGAMMGNQNTMAVYGKNGDVILLVVYGPQGGRIAYHFDASGNLLSSWQAGAGKGIAKVMALDQTSGDLGFVERGQEGISVTDLNGNGVGGGNMNGQSGWEIAAAGGYFMALQPTVNTLVGANILTDPLFDNYFSYTSLNDPCSLDAVQSGSALYAVILNCGTNTLQGLSIPDLTSLGKPLSVPGLTQSGSGSTLAQIKLLSSGVGVLLDPLGKQAFLFNIGSMQLIGQPVSLDGFPNGVIANEAANTFEITFASSAQAVPTGVDVLTTTGTKTTLNVSSTKLPLGRGVSPNGKTIYFGDRTNALDIEDNN